MIYIASPYSDPDPAVREARFFGACRYAADLVREGRLVYSPIAHHHGIAIHAKPPLPEGWAFWQEQDLPMLERCTDLHVLMLPGYADSEGVACEIEAARARGMTPLFVRPEWVEYP